MTLLGAWSRLRVQLQEHLLLLFTARQSRLVSVLMFITYCVSLCSYNMEQSDPGGVFFFVVVFFAYWILLCHDFKLLKIEACLTFEDTLESCTAEGELMSAVGRLGAQGADTVRLGGGVIMWRPCSCTWQWKMGTSIGGTLFPVLTWALVMPWWRSLLVSLSCPCSTTDLWVKYKCPKFRIASTSEFLQKHT